MAKDNYIGHTDAPYNHMLNTVGIIDGTKSYLMSIKPGNTCVIL